MNRCSPRYRCPSFCWLYAALLLVCLGTAGAGAQSADSAGLEVNVRDPSGALVPEANLLLINHATHVTRAGKSDKLGRYRFTDIPIGDYTLTVTKDGFADLVESGISLSVAQSATLAVKLKVGNNNQQVDVDSTLPVVDTNRTTTGRTISTLEIENLPSNGRNFVDFALTVPGVTPQATGGQGSGLSVNGQRGRSNVIDYVLKPFGQERFERAMVRAVTRIQSIEPGAQTVHRALEQKLDQLVGQLRQPKPWQDRIAMPIGDGRLSFIEAKDIDWVEAQGNNLKIHCGQRCYEVRETLSRFHRRLDPGVFLRIHRSTVVNLNQIREVQTWFKGHHLVVLRCGKELRMSRHQNPGLDQLLRKDLVAS